MGQGYRPLFWRSGPWQCLRDSDFVISSSQCLHVYSRFVSSTVVVFTCVQTHVENSHVTYHSRHRPVLRWEDSMDGMREISSSRHRSGICKLSTLCSSRLIVRTSRVPTLPRVCTQDIFICLPVAIKEAMQPQFWNRMSRFGLAVVRR